MFIKSHLCEPKRSNSFFEAGHALVHFYWFFVFFWELVLYEWRAKSAFELSACLFWARRRGRRLNIDIKYEVFPFLVVLLTHLSVRDADLPPHGNPVKKYTRGGVSPRQHCTIACSGADVALGMRTHRFFHKDFLLCCIGMWVVKWNALLEKRREVLSQRQFMLMICLNSINPSCLTEANPPSWN